MEKDAKDTKRPLSFNEMSTGQIKKILNEEAKSNKVIEKDLKAAAEEMRKEVTLLLLGAGEAGKSTILKQLRILHDQGFKDDERDSYIRIIRKNVITGLKEGLAEDIASIDEKTEFESVLADIRTLLKSQAVASVLGKVGEFQIPDSTPYFFENLDRIAEASYRPTEQDIVLSRVMTTSIVEYKFVVENTPFRIVDVAGQRSQRKKWFHFFDNVTAMIFVASLSNYNMPLREAPEMNAMLEQIALFKEMINGPWFKNTDVLLFLNKRDLFEKKIETVPLSVCFSDYVPDETKSKYDDCTEFIRTKFLQQNQNPDKTIYTHFTCATDPNNVAMVFNVVRDIIMRSVLLSD